VATVGCWSASIHGLSLVASGHCRMLVTSRRGWLLLPSAIVSPEELWSAASEQWTLNILCTIYLLACVAALALGWKRELPSAEGSVAHTLASPAKRERHRAYTCLVWGGVGWVDEHISCTATLSRCVKLSLSSLAIQVSSSWRPAGLVELNRCFASARGSFCFVLQAQTYNTSPNLYFSATICGCACPWQSTPAFSSASRRWT